MATEREKILAVILLFVTTRSTSASNSGNCVDVTVTHLHEDHTVRPVILIASEGSPAVVDCEITHQSQREVGWVSPILRLSAPENGTFPYIDLSDQEPQGDHSKHDIGSKYYAKFSVYPMNFSQAIAVCGICYQHREELNSTSYCFESSFVVIVGNTHHSHGHTSSTNCNNNPEVLVTSIVTGIFGLLTISLLVVVGFLFLKLRRATTASTAVNPLLYVKKEVDNLEEKKDTLEKEATNLSNDASSSQHVGIIDHKLPDTFKSRENGTHSMPC